ncbi:MAG: hypothetical protein WCP35_07725 [Verrucomicrobiota bacterium]
MKAITGEKLCLPNGIGVGNDERLLESRMWEIRKPGLTRRRNGIGHKPPVALYSTGLGFWFHKFHLLLKASDSGTGEQGEKLGKDEEVLDCQRVACGGWGDSLRKGEHRTSNAEPKRISERKMDRSNCYFRFLGAAQEYLPHCSGASMTADADENRL